MKDDILFQYTKKKIFYLFNKQFYFRKFQLYTVLIIFIRRETQKVFFIEIMFKFMLAFSDTITLSFQLVNATIFMIFLQKF